MENRLSKICSQFQLEGSILSVKPLGQGFINDTLLITTAEATTPNYILQRKNKNIFKDVPAMMDNIYRVTNHLKKKIVAAGGDPMREAMTIIPTKDGKLYYQDEDGEFWAVCVFVSDTIDYQKADTPELAYQGGKGIGKFQAMLSDFKEPLADILPGFHNIRYRFKQWDEVLAKDPVGRKATVPSEIQWIERRREEMLHFWELVENGTIPTRVTHNDTKINNILFDKAGNVLCVIDLDTVSMNIDIFRGYTQGYLSETAKFLNQSEIDYLAFSAKYITYEQVLRFLMDYIDGDKYYKVKNQVHNLIRARAQHKLLQSMEDQYTKMCDIVKEEINKLK